MKTVFKSIRADSINHVDNKLTKLNRVKKNELKEKPTEKLKSELKGIKTVTGALIGVLIVLFAVNLYGLILKDNNATFIAGMAVAIALSAIFPLQLSNIKKNKTELKLRENIN